MSWRPQRRSRRIAMTPEERDAFLSEQRTSRVATASQDGRPHVSPLWFVWDGSALWLYSIVRSQRWTDLERNPRCAVVVDAGVHYGELRGVEFAGDVERVGEIPRTGEPNPELESVERAFARRYWDADQLELDGRHAWLRLRPEREYTWDFRKIPTATESS
jgi:hypothetical protein